MFLFLLKKLNDSAVFCGDTACLSMNRILWASWVQQLKSWYMAF